MVVAKFVVLNLKMSQSKADFIHKFKVTAKEVDETELVNAMKQSRNYPDPDTLLEEVRIISRLISKIISSSKH